VTQDTVRDQLRHQLSRQLDDGLLALGLNPDNPARQKLVDYVLLLQKWNRVYNLTAVRHPELMIGRHLLDSLSILPWLPSGEFSASAALLKNCTEYDVLDVGSGAGLPVLPLSIVAPSLRFVSVESSGKKTRFQQQAVQELDVGNVHIVSSRIEAVACTANTIVSRAFTAPADFLNTVKPFCVNGSTVIIMLGLKKMLPAELPSGFTLHELRELDVPQCDSTRHVAVCKYV